MIRLKYLFIVLTFISGFCFSEFSYEVPDGKAVVYFVRYRATGAQYHLYDNEKYIGTGNSGSHFRYVVEPGEHLFWAANAGRRHFCTSILQKGKVYLIFLENASSGRRGPMAFISRTAMAIPRLKPINNKNRLLRGILKNIDKY